MSDALERLFEASECRTQTDLADFLGIRQSSISSAKNRGVIPAEWLLKLLRRKGINPEWVLTGESPRIMQAAHDAATVGSPPADMPRSPKEWSSQELANELVRRTRDSGFSVSES